MTFFCSKKIISEQDLRLGTKLKNAREVFNIDIRTASNAIKVPGKYLTALEKNRFNDLPKAKIFRLNYLKKYANFLHLNEEETEEQFIKENGLKNIEQIHPKKFLKNTPLFSISIFARNFLITSFLLMFIAYLAWQVKGILEPPKLVIYNPAEGITIMDNQINVQGETDNECRLTINGQEIRADEKGRFNLKVDLSHGLNTIVISAIKKHGKVSTITRHIVVKSFTYSKNNIISKN